MDFQNLVPLYIDKVTGNKVATHGDGSGNPHDQSAVLIELTDNGDHNHSAFLTTAEATALIAGTIVNVTVESSETDHDHDVTLTYANGAFTVTDISNNHLHGFVIIGGSGGGSGSASGYRHEQTIPSQSWVIVHNGGTTDCVTQVYVNDEMVIPTRIRLVDINTVEIYFNEPISGHSNTVFFTQA
jgi:hypothetical protein